MPIPPHINPMPTEESMEAARVVHDKLAIDGRICHDCFQREASEEVCGVCTTIAQAIDDERQRVRALVQKRMEEADKGMRENYKRPNEFIYEWVSDELEEVLEEIGK